MSDSKELSAEERDAKRTEAALALFLERWRALPPLIRAGAADVLRQQSAISFSREDRDAKDAKGLLPRRAAVYLAFRNAHGALHDLACELCRLADEEAERVGQGPLVRSAPADLVHPPLVVDKERVEKAVVSYSGQDMEGDPGPSWDPNGHPRCRKCQQPFRPAFAPLAPDTLVPSCKCTPPRSVSRWEAKPNTPPRSVSRWEAKPNDCPYCYVGEDGKMRCKGPPPEEYVANLDATQTAALFCTCGEAGGDRCSVHPEEKT